MQMQGSNTGAVIERHCAASVREVQYLQLKTNDERKRTRMIKRMIGERSSF
jgi:hypothetical protein